MVGKLSRSLDHKSFSLSRDLIGKEWLFAVDQ